MLALLAVLYLLVEHGCREKALPRQADWFQLVAAGQLGTSKKAHTRGDIDHHGRTRRQRAHT